MAKQYGQKLKTLYVLDILKKQSDENHPVNASVICKILEDKGIPCERKSVYDDISALIDYGYNIIKTYRGFFLAQRDFETSEIYLLEDAVRTAKFITAKKTRIMVKKLDSMLSIYQAENRKKRIYYDMKFKCTNEEIFYSIDTISSAIEQKKKIKLIYFIRELSPEREIKTTFKTRIISPYGLTWQDDNYYLLGNYNKYDNIIHMRLDRMKSVEILDENIRNFSEVSEYKDVFDISDYTEKLFSMYGGKLYNIELRCNKKILEQVADRFSSDIFIKNATEDEFCFSINAAVSDALVTWIISYGEKIKVLSPEFLKDKVCDRCRAVLNKY